MSIVICGPVYKTVDIHFQLISSPFMSSYISRGHGISIHVHRGVVPQQELDLDQG